MSTCLSDIIKDYALDFLALQETMKKNFSARFFRNIDPGDLFVWNWISSVGKAGGILCSVKKEKFDVVSWNVGKFILQATHFDVEKKVMWALLVVYGAAHDDLKDEFLVELASFCSHLTVPYIVGGDFNILREAEDNNKKMIHNQFVDKFNSVINSLNLPEIHLNGGKYTWSNQQAHPTLEKLDRILMSFGWEDLFPLVSVRKLVRDKSDHNPLLLSSDIPKSRPKKKREFRFELSWFADDNFLPLAKKIWEQPVNSTDPIEILNVKLKRFKKFFKGWGSNRFGHMRKRKNDIKSDLENMEKQEEEAP